MLNSFLKDTLINTYGENSNAMKAYNLVIKEMCREKGFVRRYDLSHYYTHCLNVAFNLIAVGIKDQDVISAALLHDIIEDVEGYNYDTLKYMFNERIASLVYVLSKKDNIDYKKKANLVNYLDSISYNLDAAVIKASDRLHNMQTLNGSSLRYMYDKAIETEKYFIPFITKCESMCLNNNEYKILFLLCHSLIWQEIVSIKKMYLNSIK